MLFALLLVLAGCFGPGDSPSPSPSESPPAPYAWIDPLAFNQTHDHGSRSQHQLASNVSLLAHLSLTEEDGQSAQSHSIDLCETWVALGRERQSDFGVDIVDVSNASAPVWVGRYRDPDAIAGDRDVAWSDDCRYLFMANQGPDTDSAGVRVINTEDKANPRFESFYAVPAGPLSGLGLPSPIGSVHTIYALKIGDVQYVYALNYGVHILRLDPGSGGPRTLSYVGRYITADAEQLILTNAGNPDTTATRREIYGHDLSVYEEDGRVFMYVAYAYDGLRIVDITDPRVPQDVGHWIPNETPGAPHYVHSVKTYRDAADRRITILGAETFEDRNTDTPSPLWVLDTTDFASIELLATWTNPAGVGADHLLFSLHFYEVEAEQLWLTHYHGGVWVLNLTDPAGLGVAGYYMPAADTGYVPNPDCCAGWKFAGLPMSFDLKVRNRTAYVADFSTGLYILRLSDA